jgi:hypothetical protein
MEKSNVEVSRVGGCLPMSLCQGMLWFRQQDGWLL